MERHASPSLEDEVFCLQHELKSFSQNVLDHKLERWIEGFTPPCVHVEHMQRYEFACQFTKGRKVLDIACGTGRGSRVLAEAGGATEVIGVDVDADTIRYAQNRNRHARVNFQVGDAMELNNLGLFDAIVSFETIEHIPKPDLFLDKMAEAMKPDGILLVSSPVSRLEIDTKPLNPYHVQEWSCAAFQRLISGRFRIKQMHVQYRHLPARSLLERIISKIRDLPGPTRPLAPTWKELRPPSFATEGLESPWEGFQILVCSRA